MDSGQFRDLLLSLHPGLPQAVATRLTSAFKGLVRHPARIAMLTDEEMLAGRNFGQAHLDAFRVVCPVPVIDAWVEHAAMVAGG